MLMKIPLLIPKGANFLKAAANNRSLSGLKPPNNVQNLRTFRIAGFL